MASGTCSGASGVLWPTNLLLAVKRHLDHVEDAVAPSIPPMPSSAPSIFDFFETHHDAIAAAMQRRGFDPTATDCCIAFLVGVLEQSCALSFLLSRERRIISLTVRQVEKRLLSKARSNLDDTKRRRLEDRPATESRYARVLTLEYLLRLFVSLPMILEHYDKLWSAAMPVHAAAPIWGFVNATMEILSADPRLFSPITLYVPLR